MRAHPGSAPTSSDLPDISRRDRADFVKEARRLREAEFARLSKAMGRGLARLWPSLAVAMEPRPPISQNG